MCNAKASIQGLPLPSRKTVMTCEECNVGHCLTRDRNCFKLWHDGSAESVKIQDWYKVRGNYRKRKC